MPAIVKIAIRRTENLALNHPRALALIEWHMSIDTRPPRRSSASFATIVGCILMVGAAVWMGFSLWTQAATWWRMRSYVPATAQLVEATLHRSGESTRSRSKSSSGWPYTLTAHYRYKVDGVAFSGTELGPALSSPLSMSDQAAYRRLMVRSDQFHVWIDPRNPGVAVLEREFGWFRALVIFGIAMLVMIPVYNIVGAPRPLAYERRVRADPGSWFVSCAVALQWNLMAIPIVSVALVVTAHFFRLRICSLPAGCAWRRLSDSGMGRLAQAMGTGRADDRNPWQRKYAVDLACAFQQAVWKRLRSGPIFAPCSVRVTAG